MAVETGQFKLDPAQLKDFELLVRNKQIESLHPTLARREREADAILAQMSELELPHDVPALLLPHPADQPLTLTPYDDFEEKQVRVLSEEHIEGWKRTREENLKIANHPIRLTAMRILQEQKFTPPPKINGIIDQALENGEPLQLSDLAQNTDFIDMIRNGSTHAPKNEIERVLFLETAKLRKQVHRTDILAAGPFSFVGRRVRSTVGGGAMPDIMGSVASIVTMAQMGGIAHVPEVGKFHKIDNQVALAEAALETLKDPNNPLFIGRSPEDIAFMVDLWASSVVGVTEVNAEKAKRRAYALAQAGIRSLRIYGHTQGGDVVHTVEELRKEYPDFEIFASQITNEFTALACEAAGADAIIVGVGSGGRCSTADRSQLIPANTHLPWALRGKLSIPIIGEGGAIDEPVVSILVGMSGVYGSGSLGGGTLEAPGGIYYLQDASGQLMKPYGGEASDRFKWLSGRTYGTGLPYFSEGKQTFKPLIPYRESMTQNIIDTWEDIVLGAVVMGLNEGPFTIKAMQAYNPSPLWRKSPTTQHLQQPH